MRKTATTPTGLSLKTFSSKFSVSYLICCVVISAGCFQRSSRINAVNDLFPSSPYSSPAGGIRLIPIPGKTDEEGTELCQTNCASYHLNCTTFTFFSNQHTLYTWRGQCLGRTDGQSSSQPDVYAFSGSRLQCSSDPGQPRRLYPMVEPPLDLIGIYCRIHLQYSITMNNVYARECNQERPQLWAKSSVRQQMDENGINLQNSPIDPEAGKVENERGGWNIEQRDEAAR
jgi:hypothetical protein